MILPGQPLVDDIDAGFAYIREQIAAGRGAHFIGRGSREGFMMIVGAQKRFELGGGATAIGVELSAAHLAVLRDRVVELLHGAKGAARIRSALGGG